MAAEPALPLREDGLGADGDRRLDILIPGYLENPDAFAQTRDMDFSAILTIAASNLIFALGCLVVFEVFRRNPESVAFFPKVLWRPHLTYE